MIRNTPLFIIAAVGLFCIFTTSLFCAPPPTGVNEVIEEMGEFEQSYETGNWIEAKEAFEKIRKEMGEILQESKTEDPLLTEVLVSLEKHVDERNEDRVEGKYILFQNRFFEFIKKYDYEVHPILSMIEKYVVEESAEAYEKKNYNDVISEMSETGNLITRARPFLFEKGVSSSDVNEFKNKVLETIIIGEKGDYAKMGELLKQVQAQYTTFMQQVKKN